MSPSGFGVSSLFSYVPSHKLIFRRLLAGKAAEIDAITGYRIAIAALKMHKTKYGIGDFLDTGLQSLSYRVGRREKVRMPKRGAICSELFNQAVVAVTGGNAVMGKPSPFQPADLSSSKMMCDVAVPWTALK